MSVGREHLAERLEKLMALTPAEFAGSLAVLHPAWDGAIPVAIPSGSGRVSIHFEALPSVRLGGLLELPRARVTLSLEGVSLADRAAFLRRFDMAFQRGGG
jgi:hypothetical protein